MYLIYEQRGTGIGVLKKGVVFYEGKDIKLAAGILIKAGVALPICFRQRLE
jgi:hypothetical protein